MHLGGMRRWWDFYWSFFMSCGSLSCSLHLPSRKRFFCTTCFAYSLACSLWPKKYLVTDYNFSSWSFGCLLIWNAILCAWNTENEAKGKLVYAYRGPVCYREEDRRILQCLEFLGRWKSNVSVPAELTAGILQSSKDSMNFRGDIVC